MFSIGIFTTTRAEFGILEPVIKRLSSSKSFNVSLFVGGTHLDENYGKTISEIFEKKIEITDTFDYLLNENTSHSLSKSLGIAIIEISHIFKKYNFDYVCVLGDRYELLSIISNAILYKKPIIHIGGGESTQGLIDEQIRHMITKAAHIHFTTCDEYSKKIIDMGEEQWRVKTCGSPAIETINSIPKKSKNKVFSDLGINPDLETAIMTYHPVTLEFNISVKKQVENIFKSLDKTNYQLVVTSPNIEVDRDQIVSIIKDEVKKNDNYYYFDSLGFERYHSLLPFCKLMIGNSSSGILEAPYHKIPTINIGSRQDGRIKHPSIIDANYSSESISSSLNKISSNKFIENIKSMKYKFGDGSTSQIIHDQLKLMLKGNELLNKKLI